MKIQKMRLKIAKIGKVCICESKIKIIFTEKVENTGDYRIKRET